MISEYKISQFIALLISDTKKNEVTWHESDNRNVDSLEGEQLLKGKVFITSFKEQELRLFKYSQPIQVDEFEYQKTVFVKLEFIEKYSEISKWAFPSYVRELFDLYETVQIKVNNIDTFFDKNFPNLIL